METEIVILYYGIMLFVMGLCHYVDLCFHASSLHCLHTFWHSIPTSFYIFNVFFFNYFIFLFILFIYACYMYMLQLLVALRNFNLSNLISRWGQAPPTPGYKLSSKKHLFGASIFMLSLVPLMICVHRCRNRSGWSNRGWTILSQSWDIIMRSTFI